MQRAPRSSRFLRRAGIANVCGNEFRPLALETSKLDVLRHDDVSHNHEAVTLARLFENGDESVAATGVGESPQSPIPRARDKVQMACAMSAM